MVDGRWKAMYLGNPVTRRKVIHVVISRIFLSLSHDQFIRPGVHSGRTVIYGAREKRTDLGRVIAG